MATLQPTGISQLLTAEMFLASTTIILCIIRTIFGEMIDTLYTSESIDKIVIHGFPVAIPCGHADIMDSAYEGSEIEDAENLYYIELEESAESEQNIANYGSFNGPEDDDLVECEIYRDDILIYNETIIWKNNLLNGSFGYADENWINSSKITIVLAWGADGGIRTVIPIQHKSPDEDVCVESEIEYDERDIGESIELECKSMNLIQHFSKEQYDSLTVSWWKGCERIERNDSNFEYIPATFNQGDPNGVMYDSLKILKASLLHHPGVYHCVLETRAENGEMLQYVHTSIKLCLKQPYSFSNQPEVKLTSEEYVVQPGGSLTIIATGSTGTSPKSLFQLISLEKLNSVDEWDLICETDPHFLEGDCLMRVHMNPVYCNVLTTEEIAEAERDGLYDNYTATFHIRNVTNRVEGMYRISFVTTGRPSRANFTVRVRYPARNPQWLVIILSVAGETTTDGFKTLSSSHATLAVEGNTTGSAEEETAYSTTEFLTKSTGQVSLASTSTVSEATEDLTFQETSDFTPTDVMETIPGLSTSEVVAIAAILIFCILLIAYLLI